MFKTSLIILLLSCTCIVNQWNQVYFYDMVVDNQSTLIQGTHNIESGTLYDDINDIYLGLRVEAPYKEGALNEEVIWDGTENAISNTFNDLEQGKDQPVSQPEGIVSLAGTLNSLDGSIDWEEKTNQVAGRNRI